MILKTRHHMFKTKTLLVIYSVVRRGCKSQRLLQHRYAWHRLYVGTGRSDGVSVRKQPRTNEATLGTVHFLLLPFCDTTPDKTGIYRMYAFNSKVLIVIICALVMAIAVHSIVYLGIDAASLSAEMPAR
jgi:hypothetical protein